jgi:pSer/pThr/pTyr-binding forkhead associated (FHA) protein
VTEGPAKGQSFLLETHRLVLIGRDARCTFQILDPRMSRRHMQIKLDESSGRHHAVDFESSNGVFVNGRQIESETALKDSDVIQLGDTTLVYHVTDSENAQRTWDLLRRQGQGMVQTQLRTDVHGKLER